MNHRHHTCCHAYFFLECECVTILEKCDINVVIKIVKLMKQLVHDYHLPKLVERSKPPSHRFTLWNGRNQAIYTRRVFVIPRLQNGYPPPCDRIRKRNMYLTYLTIVQRHDHFR